MQVGAAGLQRKPLERIHHRCSVAHYRMPGNNAAEGDGYSTVEESAGHECGEDAEGQIALRIVALLSGRRNGVEADVREENDGAAGEHAGKAVGHEWMPVARVNEAGSGDDEGEDGNDFDKDENVVGSRRLANAAHQNHGKNHHHQKRRDIKTEVPSGLVEVVAGEILEAGVQVGRRDPLERGMETEPLKQRLNRSEE